MIITAEIIDAFRLEFNGTFSDVVKWPDSVVESALCEADTETGGKGWGAFEIECHNFKWRGMIYFAAHWLTANYPSGAAAGTISPSDARLNISAKSVGDESITYRIASILDAGNDWLAYTSFGQQFYRLRRRAAIGARAV